MNLQKVKKLSVYTGFSGLQKFKKLVIKQTSLRETFFLQNISFIHAMRFRASVNRECMLEQLLRLSCPI